jgi:hypothetical protein
MKAYDINKAATILHFTYIGNSLIKLNTSNSARGWSGWPYTSIASHQEGYWTQG